MLTLKRQSNRKIFLIVDLYPVHYFQKTQKWIHKHPAKIRLTFVPAYSPDLNPNLPARYTQTSEMLNHDVTSNAVLPVPVVRQTDRKERPSHTSAHDPQRPGLPTQEATTEIHGETLLSSAIRIRCAAL